MFLPGGPVDVHEKMLPRGGRLNLRHQRNHLLLLGPRGIPELGYRLIHLWKCLQELRITEPLQRLGLRYLGAHQMRPTHLRQILDPLGRDMGGSHRRLYGSLHHP